MTKYSQIKGATRRTLQCLAVLGMAGLCLPAIGQDNETVETGEPVAAAEEGAQRLPIQFTAGGSRQFNTTIENGGNFSINRFRTGLGVPVRLNDQFTLSTSIKYQLDAYDFGGGTDPWGDVNTLSGIALLHYRLDDHWLFYGGPILRVAAESGASWNNATRAGGMLALNYIANEQLSFGGGIVVMGQIAENARVLPILTANWRFAEDWKATLGFTDLATSGYGADVAWSFCEDGQLTLGGQAHKSHFRINGNGPTENGVGQESSFTLTVAATWAPSKSFSATAFAGLAIGGKIELDTSNGTQLRNDSYHTAPIIGAKATIQF